MLVCAITEMMVREPSLFSIHAVQACTVLQASAEALREYLLLAMDGRSRYAHFCRTAPHLADRVPLAQLVTYATVQSLFNRNVRHAAFFALFFGGTVLPLLAALANLRHWRAPTFWLLLAATLAYGLGVVVFTHEVNLPLNAYTESWRPDQLPADWTMTREQWNAANTARVWMACTALALSLGALVLRASGVGVRALEPNKKHQSRLDTMAA